MIAKKNYKMFEKEITEEIEDMYSKEQCDQMTILEMMEELAEQSERSNLSDDFFKQVSTLAEVLGKKLNITATQAIIYSIFVDNYNDPNLQLVDLRRHTGARLTKLAQFQGDIDALEKARLISRSSMCSRNSENGYCVPMAVITALRENIAYKPEVYTKMKFSNFARKMDNIVNERFDKGMPFEMMTEDFEALQNSNTHLKCVQELQKFKEETGSYNEWVFMTIMCCCELFHNKRFGLGNLRKIFNKDEAEHLQELFDLEITHAQEKGFIEYNHAEGLADRDCVVLSAKGKKLFLSEAKKKQLGFTDASNVIKHESIAKKELFFDEGVQKEVDRLCTMLLPKQFKNICKRLEKRGMRKGLCTLLWGYPGTGKTELVKQLSKQTGRNIITINVTDIKNKYVGESEKNIKEVFENYRSALKTEKLEPILLFDEADQILSKRIENVQQAVDQMANSIQNIILQEMQDFEGIMICTTNLVGNLDEAFNRRFLFKIRFEKPSAIVRQKIWQSMMPEVTDDVAEKLAKSYELSGGQLDNVTRKYVIDSILYGDSADMYKTLSEYCDAERLQGQQRKQIGFAV